MAATNMKSYKQLKMERDEKEGKQRLNEYNKQLEKQAELRKYLFLLENAYLDVDFLSGREILCIPISKEFQNTVPVANGDRDLFTKICATELNCNSKFGEVKFSPVANAKETAEMIYLIVYPRETPEKSNSCIIL